jgi:hypothetical protein
MWTLSQKGNDDDQRPNERKNARSEIDISNQCRLPIAERVLSCAPHEKGIHIQKKCDLDLEPTQ